jgi:hypothetical protein
MMAGATNELTQKVARALLVDELANELRHHRHSNMASAALAEHTLAIQRIHDAIAAIRENDGWQETLAGVASLLDEVKTDRSSGSSSLPWNDYHDGLRSELTRLLESAAAMRAAAPLPNNEEDECPICGNRSTFTGNPAASFCDKHYRKYLAAFPIAPMDLAAYRAKPSPIRRMSMDCETEIVELSLPVERAVALRAYAIRSNSPLGNAASRVIKAGLYALAANPQLMKE